VQNGVDATDRGEGIGAYVRATMARLPESGRLTPEIVAELSNARYSKTAAIDTDQGSQILAGVAVGLLTDATTDEFIEVFRQRYCQRTGQDRPPESSATRLRVRHANRLSKILTAHPPGRVTH
jgi:hypothetical protein